MSPYRAAIDQTIRAVERRGKHFRNLIAAVVLVSLGSIIWAAVGWTFLPLTGLFLLFPVCALFFLLDATLMNSWRARLLESWIKKQLDFQGLRLAVAAIPTLPKNTLHGMLESLPSADDLVAEQAISSSTRGAIAIAVRTIYRSAADAMALRVVGYAIASCSLIAAAVLRTWQPLLGIVAVVSLPLAGHLLQLLQLHIAMKKTLVVQRQPDFDAEKYLIVLDRLAWDPISNTGKARFVERVRSAK